MSKERYKYTPEIEELTSFGSFREVRKTIDAQKSLYTENHDGFVIETERGQLCEGVVTIDLHYPADSSSECVNIVRLAKESSLRLVIYHHSTESAKIKNSLEIEIGDNSRLELVEIVDTRSTIISDVNVSQGRDSRFNTTVLDLNNRRVVRNQYVNLNLKGAECSLSGLYLTAEGEHTDNYVRVRHAVSNCTSNQLFKGILGGKSSAAFTGHILVDFDAQQTAAFQENHNILLSDAAKVNSRPQLEIYADDVKCNHGATVGRLDPEAIYYMRQRGISVEAARRLQLTGFAEDVLRLDSFGNIQELIHQKITHKLNSI